MFLYSFTDTALFYLPNLPSVLQSKNKCSAVLMKTKASFLYGTALLIIFLILP